MSTETDSALVPTSPIVLTVDTARLVSDDAVPDRRDLHAFDFLKHECGITSGVSFFTGKLGAVASFSEYEFFLELGDWSKGKIRKFTFSRRVEGRTPDELDTGVVLRQPDQLDDDEKLLFECRSTKHNFTWFFQCLTREDAQKKSASRSPSPSSAKPPMVVEPEEETPAEIEIPREHTLDEGKKFEARTPRPAPLAARPPSVATAATTTPSAPTVPASRKVVSTIAGGPNGGVPAQPAEKDGEQVMNANGKDEKLVKHIVKAVCKAVGDKNVTPLKLKRGKAEGENATLARKAIAHLACALNEISPSTVFPVFGNKNSGGVYTLKDGAAKQYAEGGPLKELVDKVQADIPAGLLNGKAGATTAEPVTSVRRKRTPRTEKPPRQDRPEGPISEQNGKADKDLLIFLTARCKDKTPSEVADTFAVSLAEVHRACGRFYLADLHGDPEVEQLVALFEKVQSRVGS